MDTWQVFARKLFLTKEADPGYYALADSGMSDVQKMRAMVAWCTYYNLAYAAVASELKGDAFWDYLDSIYDTAKRATERRHFRGAAGRKALAAWRHTYGNHPEDMVVSSFGDTFFEVRNKVGRIPQMGDYFIWKFADVQERVFRVPCNFIGADEYVPKTPRQGAAVIACAEGLDTDQAGWLEHTHEMIIESMRGVRVPPAYDREFNLQEAETVCCVYKQMVNGSYVYGLRSAKSMMRLQTVQAGCRTARRMLDVLTEDGQLTNTLTEVFNAHLPARHKRQR